MASDRAPDPGRSGWLDAGRSLGGGSRGVTYFDTTRAIAVEFTEGEHAEPEEWRGAVLSNVDLWLTVDEFHWVAEELGAVLEPYRGRAGRGERPLGSRRVRAMNVVVPRRRAKPEPGSRGP